MNAPIPAASPGNTPVQPTSATSGPPALADRLRGVRVGTRQDLEVTRHVFRGRPAYVVRDPMTFQNHRFDPADYAVFVGINTDRTLGEIFDELVAQGKATQEDEEAFYQFIVSLHRLNFLNLPIADEKLLYQRYQARQRARRKEKLLGFLFLRVPLVNPDAFLDRTIRYARPIFGRWFFAGWLALGAAAAFVAAGNFDELIQPAQGVLAARNLPIMWLTLVGLKILHEFGHAYACKLYGGHVPEMGAYFIVFTPCAYVDATACWGFTKRHQRLAVCLAGMYVEAMVASLAVFAWAFSSPGLLRDVAYNVLFLAGVVTVLFNINPLMRYDGYYVLSDLLEIPNLRQRATRQVVDLLKRIFVGVPARQGPATRWERVWLVTYGLAASLYRTTLVLAIAAMLASKVFLVGFGVAAFYLGNTGVGLLRNVTRYLWFAQETARVRVRAIAVSVLLLAGVPALIVLVPVRTTVQAPGTVNLSEESVIRAPADGFVRAAWVDLEQTVQAGDLLVELSNDAPDESIAAASSALQASDVRRRAYEVTDPARAFEEDEQAGVYRAELERHQADRARLTVRAASAGQIIDCLRQRDVGRFLREGDPLATIAAGQWQLRTVLTEQQIAAVNPVPGDHVEIRLEACPLNVLDGVVRRVASLGSRTLLADSLTHVGGGDIAVDPRTRQARQPYFEVTIDLPDLGPGALRHGLTAQARFQAGAQSIGTIAIRRLIRFANALQQR